MDLRLPGVESQDGYVPKEEENHQIQNQHSSLNTYFWLLLAGKQGHCVGTEICAAHLPDRGEG